MNAPFWFWKLFDSNAHSGSAIERSSQATSKMMPARMTHASRERRGSETRGTVGIAVTVIVDAQVSSRTASIASRSGTHVPPHSILAERWVPGLAALARDDSRACCVALAPDDRRAWCL